MKGLFASLMQSIPERRETDISALIDRTMGGSLSKTGIVVNAESALHCTTVLACTMAIASGVAMLPFKLYQALPDGGRKEAVDNPLYDLLDTAPNEWQTSVEFMETWVMHAVLAADGYAYKNYVRGRLYELIPLLPSKVFVRQLPDYTLVYDISLPDGTVQPVERKYVMHLRSPSWNGYSGLAAVKLARDAIGLALATEETHARLHANGTRPGGVLSTAATLDEDQVKLIREQWQQTQGGVANAMRTAILGGGLAWTPLAMTGVDSQHIETRRFQIEEICRAMGVFPQMVGHSDKTATFASAEAFFLAHVVHTLSRWTRRVEKRVSLDLLTPADRKAGLYPKFSYQALLRGDNKTRAEFYQVLVMLGVMTRNEARLLEELNPLPGLDTPLVPVSNATPQAMAKMLAATLREANGNSALEARLGRILSASNEALIQGARDNLDQVLIQLATEETDA
jgi:HK97 family phage portal protein